MPRVHPRLRRRSARAPNASGGSDVFGTLVTLTGNPGLGYGTWAVTS
jgi:hypothetical protein